MVLGSFYLRSRAMQGASFVRALIVCHKWAPTLIPMATLFCPNNPVFLTISDPLCALLDSHTHFLRCIMWSEYHAVRRGRECTQKWSDVSCRMQFGNVLTAVAGRDWVFKNRPFNCVLVSTRCRSHWPGLGHCSCARFLDRATPTSTQTVLFTCLSQVYIVQAESDCDSRWVK